MTREQTRPLEPRHLAGNLAVRKTCGRVMTGKDKAVVRKTLIYWRERHEFPAPLPAPRAGVELWDIREVREWVHEYKAVRDAELAARQ